MNNNVVYVIEIHDYSDFILRANALPGLYGIFATPEEAFEEMERLIRRIEKRGFKRRDYKGENLTGEMLNIEGRRHDFFDRMKPYADYIIHDDFSARDKQYNFINIVTHPWEIGYYRDKRI